MMSIDEENDEDFGALLTQLLDEEFQWPVEEEDDGHIEIVEDPLNLRGGKSYEDVRIDESSAKNGTSSSEEANGNLENAGSRSLRKKHSITGQLEVDLEYESDYGRGKRRRSARLRKPVNYNDTEAFRKLVTTETTTEESTAQEIANIDIVNSNSERVLIPIVGKYCTATCSPSAKHLYIYDASDLVASRVQKLLSVNLMSGVMHAYTGEGNVFRKDHTAVFIGRHRLLVYGGVQPQMNRTLPAHLTSLVVYHTTRKVWSAFPLTARSPVPPERYAHASCLSPDRKSFYVSGGISVYGSSSDSRHLLKDLWRLDLEKREWTCLSTEFLGGYKHSIVISPRNRLYVFGEFKEAIPAFARNGQTSSVRIGGTASVVYWVDLDDLNESILSNTALHMDIGKVVKQAPFANYKSLYVVDYDRGFVLDLKLEVDTEGNSSGSFDLTMFDVVYGTWTALSSHKIDTLFSSSACLPIFLAVGKRDLIAICHDVEDPEEESLDTGKYYSVFDHSNVGPQVRTAKKKIRKRNPLFVLPQKVYRVGLSRDLGISKNILKRSIAAEGEFQEARDVEEYSARDEFVLPQIYEEDEDDEEYELENDGEDDDD